MTLGEKRRLFTKLFCALVNWAVSSDGIEMQFEEGFVKTTDAADGDWDGPHMNGGAHYTGLAHDASLFIHGVYIDKNHPFWQDLGAMWKRMHPLCRWGGDFAKRDFNHFSLEHEGKQ